MRFLSGILVVAAFLSCVSFPALSAFAEDDVVCVRASELESLLDSVEGALVQAGAGCSSNATKKAACEGCTTKPTCDNCCQNIDDSTERTNCFDMCKTKHPKSLSLGGSGGLGSD